VQIQVAKVGLDFESEKSHTLTVKITGDDAEDKTAQITITVTDIDDTAPTNITLSNRDIASNAVIDTIIGTLSATDVDTNNNDLVYSVNNTTDFEITGNQLKLKTGYDELTNQWNGVGLNDGFGNSKILCRGQNGIASGNSDVDWECDCGNIGFDF
jgi:hypothetical protein